MKPKKCSKCKIVKLTVDFYSNSRSKDGLAYECKSCHSSRRKEYYKKNRDAIKAHNKKYIEDNPELYKELGKQHYDNNKERYQELFAQWNKNNKEKVSEYNRNYYQENKKEINAKANEYFKERYETDSLYRLKVSIRTRLNQAIKNKNFNKEFSTEEYLGAGIETVREHIEMQFSEGMNWKNHGEWHIDHIIPLSSARTEKDLLKLAHYSNLQPLWASDNLSKSDKILI